MLAGLGGELSLKGMLGLTLIRWGSLLAGGLGTEWERGQVKSALVTVLQHTQCVVGMFTKVRTTPFLCQT